MQCARSLTLDTPVDPGRAGMGASSSRDLGAQPLSSDLSSPPDHSESSSGASAAVRFLGFLLGDEAESDALAQLAAHAVMRELGPEDVLLAAGSVTDDVLLLLDGLLELRSGTDVIERLEPGTCLLGRPQAGSGTDPATLCVVAAHASTVVVLPDAAVDELQIVAPSSWRRLQGFLGRQVPSVFLTTTELFDDVDPALLTDFDIGVHGVVAGDVVVHRGDPATDVYVVAQGRLDVIAESTVIRVLGRGHTTDLAPVLLGESHKATVRATRDSEIIKISRSQLERIVDRAPTVGLRAARLVAHEMRRRPGPLLVRTVALIVDPGCPRFSSDLVDALISSGKSATLASSVRVNSQLGTSLLAPDPGSRLNPRLLQWLADLEDRYDVVVYDCDDAGGPWTQTAVRQADVVLVVADSLQGPALRSVEADLLAHNASARVELVLVRPADRVPSGTAAWLSLRRLAAHHHVRADVPSDLARVARTLTGSDFGVALSGGGARGFAHIGAFKALAAHGIEVDHVGGTSMGSVIAGEFALGWSIEEMIARNSKEFPSAAVLGDLTLPVIAMGRGRSSVKLLRNLFGETMIEDLLTPYFCVSCNLSRAEIVVHDRGPLWLWSRASSSVPGIGPPVPFGGDLLVDGGVLNNLPADVLRNRCHGPVLAVDVAAQGGLRTAAPDSLTFQSGMAAFRRGRKGKSGGIIEPTIMHILTRATTVSSFDHRRDVGQHADLHVIPDVGDVGPFEWGAISSIVEAGYRETSLRIEAWEAAGRPVNADEPEAVSP
jgi:predicted acylesterase/phospholipase RssA/CRP-like cAMP-binding protein